MCEPKCKGGMDFKYHKCFNFALLAEQGWRLLVDENSLLHKIYKAKYFPKTSFLEAKVGRNPSLTWKSIVEAKKWLVLRCRKRIGNGKDTSIWTGSWIPWHQTLELERQEGVDKVADLLDPILGWWDTPKILDYFQLRVAVEILKIPIFPNYQVNAIVWGSEKKSGYFSVKSAYKLFRAAKTQSRGECSNNSVVIRPWQQIWKMTLPNKIKVGLEGLPKYSSNSPKFEPEKV